MSISKFLINKKIVKNQDQANYLMIGIIIACVLFIVIQNLGGESPNQTQEFTPEELELLGQEGAEVNNQFLLEQ
jgi:hypothetical protein